MKTTRHSLLAKGLMVLLSLLVLIFAFTYSWYANEPKVTASGISASVESAGDFEYAIGFYNNGTGGNYKITNFTNETTALNLEQLKIYDGTSANNDGYDSKGYYHNYNLLHDYKPIDVTGDGRTLIRPSMSYGNQEIDRASNDFSVAVPNEQYISFDLYFRSTVPGVSINLGNGSWVKGGCELNSFSSMIGSSTSASFNKSTYGNFSRDAIAGAIRIAFIPYDYSTELNNIPSNISAFEDNTPAYLHNRAMFVWVPRPDIYLRPNQEGLTGWTLTQVANQNTTAVTGTTDIHQYYNIFNCQPAKSATEGGIPSDDNTYHTEATYDNTVTPATLATASQNFSQTNNLLQFTEGGTTYYYSKVNVRIWVEGTDTEARRATSGGKFEVNFKFTTM